MNKILKCSNDDPRKYNKGIVYPKENNIVRKGTPLGVKGILILIFFRNTNIMINENPSIKE